MTYSLNSYISTFQNIDLTKNFYFSYTYDITNTLQVNMTSGPGFQTSTSSSTTSTDNDTKLDGPEPNNMFVWNDYLLKTGFKNVNARSGWILRLIYGFVDQASKFFFFLNKKTIIIALIITVLYNITIILNIVLIIFFVIYYFYYYYRNINIW